VTTILKDVVWQVSRTGKLNPLAVLEPVELCGATISRATLNNLDDIAKKGVKIGTRVFVRRSNDVIPEILGVAEDNGGKEIVPPEKCPYCGGDVTVNGAFVYCNNKDNCGAVHMSRLDHFSSKEAMNIEGLSEKTILQLYNLGFIKDVDDIYDLTAEQLAQAEGFKDKKINNILTAIEKSKQVSLDSFIYSLGILNIGKKSAKQLADKYKSLDALQSATMEDLLSIDDFGEIMAQGVYDYFNNESNQKLIKSLLDKGITINFIEQKEGVLTGYNICLTGSISIPRSKAKQLITDNGGSVSDSVSKAVNVVVYGAEAGSKLEKAKKLGIELWTEEEFFEKINYKG
ncbi:MAG: NAD-dependent DNA ligase LigA, partial [Clostridia bacterium]|nr:NAD-dependent DNA ligase LigA [Clostridia bacterium]